MRGPGRPRRRLNKRRSTARATKNASRTARAHVRVFHIDCHRTARAFCVASCARGRTRSSTFDFCRVGLPLSQQPASLASRSSARCDHGSPPPRTARGSSSRIRRRIIRLRLRAAQRRRRLRHLARRADALLAQRRLHAGRVRAARRRARKHGAHRHRAQHRRRAGAHPLPARPPRGARLRAERDDTERLDARLRLQRARPRHRLARGQRAEPRLRDHGQVRVAQRHRRPSCPSPPKPPLTGDTAAHLASYAKLVSPSSAARRAFRCYPPPSLRPSLATARSTRIKPS